MEEQHTADDQSHYEISLTAGQAFIAFVLLLLSLAASFAFGLMIGKGQADERLVVRKEPAVIEAGMLPKKDSGRIVELGVAEEDVPATETTSAAETDTTGSVAVVSEDAATATIVEAAPAQITEESTEAPAPKPVTQTPAPTVAAPVHTNAPAPAPVRMTGPVYAQLLSTGDQKTAESLAAKLIDRGFTSAYVVRGSSDKGPMYRVRVKFDSEAAARAAEGRLKQFSPEVWITK